MSYCLSICICISNCICIFIQIYYSKTASHVQFWWVRGADRANALVFVIVFVFVFVFLIVFVYTEAKQQAMCSFGGWGALTEQTPW